MKGRSCPRTARALVEGRETTSRVGAVDRTTGEFVDPVVVQDGVNPEVGSGTPGSEGQ